jgi:flagellar motor protein MotB
MSLSNELDATERLFASNMDHNLASQSYLVVLITFTLLCVTALIASHIETSNNDAVGNGISKQASEPVLASAVVKEPSVQLPPNSLRIAALQQALQSRIKELDIAHYVSSGIHNNQLLLNVQSELFFDEGSIEIGRAGKEALGSTLKELDFSGITMRVEVHARRDIESEYSLSTSSQLKSFLSSSFPSINLANIQMD